MVEHNREVGTLSGRTLYFGEVLYLTEPIVVHRFYSIDELA